MLLIFTVKAFFTEGNLKLRPHQDISGRDTEAGETEAQRGQKVKGRHGINGVLQ